ncbi:HigA [Desulfofarcimen acetoxidans DSM 771]|uniref:HigA n=1 Tax=Desulfofarcimen acetoxidans (strain ATCC 49208 / DSM 771 / KCTC 5769 / VKM B-1644 / 5575) TaxID=485916 RepID=C8VW52_DESAS|nr:HigA protein [Desulfofarcimen acetoxidans]ACV62404.1 HigA [Desulfofarcimen acetoxidans DSM 771]
MLIKFKTRKLKKICDSGQEIIKKWGQGNGFKIQQRLSELRAASCLSDISHLPPPRLHELRENWEDHFSVDIRHPYRIIFKPTEPIPRKEDGGIDLSRVTEIMVVNIMDYH